MLFLIRMILKSRNTLFLRTNQTQFNLTSDCNVKSCSKLCQISHLKSTFGLSPCSHSTFIPATGLETFIPTSFRRFVSVDADCVDNVSIEHALFDYLSI
jgi:hypothetical protein